MNRVWSWVVLLPAIVASSTSPSPPSQPLVRPSTPRIFDPSCTGSWGDVHPTLPRCKGGAGESAWGFGLGKQGHLFGGLGLGLGLAAKDASGNGPVYCAAPRGNNVVRDIDVEPKTPQWITAVKARFPLAAKILDRRRNVRLTHYGFPPLHVNMTLTFWGNMIAGAISRSCAQTAMHPANVVKTLLQTRSDELGRLTPRILTRGAGAQFVLSLPHGALAFAVLEYVKSTLSTMVPVRYAGPAFDFMSSAVSTTICSVISTPQMVLTDRIMAGYYPNLVVGIKTVLKKDGFKGLYAGWFAALAQKIPSYGLTWVFFQQLKEARAKIMDHDATNSENFAMGAMAAAATVCVMIPLDTIKTRIVTQAANPNMVKPYKNLFDCAARVLREEGLITFYKPLAPRLVSVVPMIGIQFGVYEFMRRAIRSLPEPTPRGSQSVANSAQQPVRAPVPPPVERKRTGDAILTELFDEIEGEV